MNQINPKIRLVILIIAVLLMCIGTAIHYKRTEKVISNDFQVYYKTSQRIATQNWIDIYTRKDGPMPYRYLPYSLMTVSWLSHFSEADGRKIWLVIQATGFLAGFYFLYLTLILLKSREPLLTVCLSFILVFRYYLDSLYCGQVAGIFFLSYSFGLYFYLRKKLFMGVFANFITASLKIAPGISLIHTFIKARGFQKVIVFLSGFILFLGFNALLLGWLLNHDSQNKIFEIFTQLWKNWFEIVVADGEYFDGSTAKSQALRGVILRLLGSGKSSETLWKIMVIFGVIGIIANWIFSKSKSLYQDAYSYCLGIMAFILFMPQSLPYQIMNVAIPLTVFISHPKIEKSLFYKLVVVGFILFLTLPSSDFIGRNPSEWVQAKSFPFLVMSFLTIVIFRESWGLKEEKK